VGQAGSDAIQVAALSDIRGGDIGRRDGRRTYGVSIRRSRSISAYATTRAVVRPAASAHTIRCNIFTSSGRAVRSMFMRAAQRCK